MFRLFIVLLSLFLNLEACKGGYDSCKRKINDSNSIMNQTINIPLKNHQRLLFSREKPQENILKHDPFLSLYLIEDTKGFKFPYTINYKTPLGIASVNQRVAIEGKIVQHQIGLNRFAFLSESLTAPALLLTSCCSLEGFVTPEGIIEKEYLSRFIKIKKVSYADIGIRVKDDKKFVLVDAINPFMEGNNFKIDDCILSFDGKKVRDAASLMQWILFSKVGTMHTVKIKRKDKYITLKMKSHNRHGGGYLSDTFLEILGISFDKNLKIIDIKQKAKKYQLKLGDRLVQINQKNITTEAEIVKILSDTKKSSNLLFLRGGFQFFVKIKSI